jgi:hypothetical protein
MTRLAMFVMFLAFFFLTVGCNDIPEKCVQICGKGGVKEVTTQRCTCQLQ